jgi:hypothetical protein
MMTIIEIVRQLQEQVLELKYEVADMKTALGNLLPHPSPTLNTYDPHAPRPTEHTTVVHGAHPEWSGPS